MRTTPLILVVDDNPANVDILQARLEANHYDVITASDGNLGLSLARDQKPDLILLDIMMPELDGLEVCRRLKTDPDLPFIPIILVTAKADSGDIIKGFEAGSEDYLTKPVDHAALIIRVKAMLRIKELHDIVSEQAKRLEKQSAELQAWNQDLEQRVQEQLTELERVGRLKRFLSPQLADVIVSAESDRFLESHREDITVVFCDLRGFTAFSETGEPEEVMGVLNEYHASMGALIFRFEGTLERFTGDGLMVFFNDPRPCPEPAWRAVRMAAAMRKRVAELNQGWFKRGYQLGFGVGIARGYATLGKIGFEGRFDYAAIGTVTNLAARLCGEAANGQILISQRVYGDIEDRVTAEPLGQLDLKGLHRSVAVYNVLALKGGTAW